MSTPHLSLREAIELYDLWLEKVEDAVRLACAKANGRRDRHKSDLADLRRDLASVTLLPLTETESGYALMPGTALFSARNARVYLDEAEQHYMWGNPRLAIIKLQLAYETARIAIDLVDTGASPFESPLPPRPTGTSAEYHDPDDMGGDWHLPIPGPRR